NMTRLKPKNIKCLPCSALAKNFEEPKERRPILGCIIMSVSITEFLTGVTEPLAIQVMFLATLLYHVQAIFTGISLFVAKILGIH
ncbi:hypothetical protein ACQWG3_24875, partial [Salmonella enterica subsp. enterica serovar Infantis]